MVLKWNTENTTLSEQFQNLIEKYHTVGTSPNSNRKINETEIKWIPLTHVTAQFLGIRRYVDKNVIATDINLALLQPKNV